MRMVHIISAALLVLWVALPVHSELVEFVDPFVITGDDPADLDPTPFGEAIATLGPLVFVGGSAMDPAGFDNAVLAAFRTRDRTEVWRVLGGPPGLVRSFSTVSAGRGKVCAAGPWSRGVVVGCYHVLTGRLLWQRLLVVRPFPFAEPDLQIQLSRTSVVLSYTSTVRSQVAQALVLSFDARDGS